jgi:XTP/dITP diphosphohydrolase
LSRLILLATSPRVAPGLLSLDAWRALESTRTRLAADPDDPLVRACTDAGLVVDAVAGVHPADLARDLVERAVAGDVLWLVSADGDPGLTDAIAVEVSSRADAPDVEVLVGSWDVPGSRLLDVVAAMDRLRSPGGCPWDAEQTHTSLAPYLLEEAHETLEAIASGDPHHLAEELGDVLLQVVFHARVAAEAADGFDIDDVAGHLVTKLVRRHPHVFGDADATTPEQVEAAWEEIKTAERAATGSHDDDLLHGVPQSLPAGLAVGKVSARARRRGLTLDEASRAELDRALAELAAAEEHALAALRRLALSARPGPAGAGDDADG